MTESKPPVPELIPRSILFGNPVKASPKISPDGKRIAYLAPLENVLNVWVGEVGGNDFRPVTKDRDRGIQVFFWAGDDRHLLYLQDVGGNENWKLYAVDLTDDQIRELTPYENVQVRIIDRDKHFPDELLISMNKENPQVHDVYHLDLKTGALEMVAKNTGQFAGWVTDPRFKVRGALATTPEGGFDLLLRSGDGENWEKYISWDPDDSLNSGPVGFSKDGRHIYLEDSRNVNASRLIKMDIETGKFEVLAEDPKFDVGGVFMDPDTYEIQAVSFAKERVQWVVLDKAIEGDFRKIKGLDDGDFGIVSRDHKNENWVVAFTRDHGPSSFYVYNRKTQEASFLFFNKPDLNRYTLASMEPVRFKSRDGLEIYGYITFPPGYERKNLPMVLNVHGGPWSRDTWGYDAESQWFANRGYICLQVNFRGSTGYGKEFLNAGDREWGGKMHDDLVDAVHWAVEQGYADPKKIAIYGGSYGGYAALVGATFTPDLFCCAVDIVGPSNLVSMIQSIPPYWSTLLAIEHKRVGNPETEAEFLKSRSPLFKVDRIKIPILVAQGANDPRVKQAESEQIVRAMKEKGIDYEYMLFPDEGHGFAKPENRIKFYAVAEKFLSKHLGGRFEE